MRECSAHDSTIAGAMKTGCTSRAVSQGSYCSASCVKVNPSRKVYCLSEVHMEGKSHWAWTVKSVYTHRHFFPSDLQKHFELLGKNYITH